MQYLRGRHRGLGVRLWRSVAFALLSAALVGCAGLFATHGARDSGSADVFSLPRREPAVARSTLGECAGVRSSATAIEFEIRFPPQRKSQEDTRVFVVPPGYLPSAEVLEIEAHQVDPWEQDDNVLEGWSGEEIARATEQFRKQVLVSPLGVARRSTLVRVAMQPLLPRSEGGPQFRVRRAKIRLSWANPWTPPADGIADGAYTAPDSAWRAALAATLANPGALAAYADPSPAATPTKLADDRAARGPLPGGAALAGPSLRLDVHEEGFYSLEASAVARAGMNPGTLDPLAVRIVSDGKELPTIFQGGFSSGFAVGDRILFWHDPVKYPTSPSDPVFAIAPAGDGGAVVRVPKARGPEGSLPPARTALPHEWELKRSEVLHTRRGNFLSIRDMQQVWAELAPGQSSKVNFDLEGIDTRADAEASTATVRLKFFVDRGSRPATGKIQVRINGAPPAQAMVLPGSWRPNMPLTDEPAIVQLRLRGGLLRAKGNEAAIEWSMTDATAKDTKVLLDRIIVQHRHALEYHKGGLIVSPGDDATTTGVLLEVSGVTPEELLALDVSGGGGGARQFEVLAGARPESSRVWISGAGKPVTRVALVRPDDARPATWRRSAGEDLQGNVRGADSIIIYHDSLTTAATRLSEIWARDGRRPRAIDVQSLYDTFSAGRLDPASIRIFLQKCVVDGWAPDVDVAALVGDCSSDFRDVARKGVANLVPSYSIRAGAFSSAGIDQDHFASDHWFTMLTGSHELSAITLGRISATNPSDADTIVKKQSEIRTIPDAPWRHRLGLLADQGGDFQEVCETIRDEMLPPEVETRLLTLNTLPYEDNFYLPKDGLEGDEKKVCPTGTRLVGELFEEGVGMLAFYGHGSPNIWSNHRLWFGGDTPNSDNQRLTNAPRYPFLFNGTCNSGAIDYPIPAWNICITEDMVRQARGGAYAAFVPSGPGYTTSHRILSQALMKAIYEDRLDHVAAACEAARFSYQFALRTDDHSRMFIVLGDPLSPLPGTRRKGGDAAAHGDLEASLQVDRDAGTARVKFGKGPSPLPTVTGSVSDLGASLPVEGVDTPLTWTLTGAESRTVEATLPGLATAVSRRHVFARASRTMISTLAETARDRAGDAAEAVRTGLTTFGEFFETGNGTVRLLPLRTDSTGQPSPTAGRPARLLVAVESLSPWLVRGDARVQVMRDGLAGGTMDAPTLAWPRTASAPPSSVLDQSMPFQLDGGVTRRFAVELPDSPPGLHVARVRLGDSNPNNATPPESSTVPPLCYAVRDAAGPARLELAVPELTTIPLDAKRMQGRAQVVVANVGATTWRGGMVTLFASGGRVLASLSTGGPIGPGEVREVPVTFPWAEDSITTTCLLTVLPTDTAPKQPPADAEYWSLRLDTSMVSDLAALPNSLKITPANPTEGETVWLDFVVENRGRMPSGAYQLKGFAKDAVGVSQDMRDRTRLVPEAFPPLKPGEKRAVRLRWDPEGNLSTRTIEVGVNPAGLRSGDGRAANNMITVPFRARKSWDLRLLGMRFEEKSPDGVTLIAGVRNEGETAARYVVVAFYPDKNYSKANRLAEVMVERIDPGQTAEFRWRWNIGPELRGVELRPECQAYIRGSMLRVSSHTQK